MPKLLALKEEQNVKRKIPQFRNQRYKLYAELCPKVKMNFAYLHNPTEEIYTVQDVDKAPARYEKDPLFSKLYEVAHVKVCQVIYLSLL